MMCSLMSLRLEKIHGYLVFEHRDYVQFDLKIMIENRKTRKVFAETVFMLENRNRYGKK